MLLERFCYGPFGTFGRLAVGSEIFWTCERPWENNQRNISCIPEGAYVLEHHSTDRYPDTWALVGGSVGHWPSEGKQRSTCVLHVGNTMDDVQGCVAVGLNLDRNGWRVLDSRLAMEALRKELYVTQGRQALITQYRPTLTNVV